MREILDTVLTWLRRWESDKWIHVVAFLLAAWGAGRLLGCCDGIAALGTACPALAGAAVAALLAVAKEWYDLRTEGLFDWQDLWASWLGVGIYLTMTLL